MAGADVVVKFVADTTQLQNSMRQVESSGDRLRNVGKGVAAALGGAAIVGAIVKTTKAASDLNETVTASQAIFGKSGAAIEKWATGAAKDFGQSKTQALDAATGFGNMFNQLGIGEDTTVRMSKKMVELASDFASFRNADISDVLAAQQSAFRGEYDALQKFVPTINAATVETKALAETGKENAKQLTAQEKAHAAYTLMIEGAGKAMGDFDRTAGGAANQQRIFAAQMQDVQATVGQALLPVLVQVLGVLSKVASAFMELPQPVQTAIVAIGLFAAAWGVLSALNLTSFIADVLRSLPRIGEAFVDAGLEVAAFIEQFVSLSTAVGAAGLGLLLLAAYQLRFKTATELANEAGKRQGQIIAENITTGTTAATAIQELTRTQSVLTAKIHETRDALDLYNLAAANNAPALQETGTNARGAADRAAELGVELSRLEGKSDTLGDALAKVKREQQLAKIEEEARQTSLTNLAAGTDQTTEATLRAVSAMQTYANQVLAAQGGAIGLEAAQLNVMRAEEQLAAVRGDSKSTLLDIATAENNLASAKLGVASAAVTANSKETEFTATLNRDAIPGLQAMRQALIDSKERHGDNTGAIQAEIDKLDGYIYVANQVPADKTTKITADVKQATADVAAFNTAADIAARNRTVFFDIQSTGKFPSGFGGSIPPSFGAGGIVPGPRGAPVLAIVHGGETVIPTSGALAVTGPTGGGATYNVNVSVAAGVSPAAVGAATVDAIRAYERQNGKSWRN